MMDICEEEDPEVTHKEYVIQEKDYAVKEEEDNEDVIEGEDEGERNEKDMKKENKEEKLKEENGKCEKDMKITTDKNGLPFIEDILKTYNDWKQVPKSKEELEKLGGSKQRKWTATYQGHWKKLFPWLQEIKVDGKVVGVVCSVCRNMSSSDYDEYCTTSINRSKGKFLSVPFVLWGDLVEAAKKHEFGKTKVNVKVSKINELRKDIFRGKVSIPQTTHLKIYLQQKTQEDAVSKSTTIIDAISRSCSITHSAMKENERVYTQAFAILH